MIGVIGTQARQALGGLCAMSTVLQWLVAAFALTAAVVGIMHLTFARRRARQEFLRRLRQACRNLHGMKNPLWRQRSFERTDEWQRLEVMSEGESLVGDAEERASGDMVVLLRRFVKLCKDPEPRELECRQDYRRQYKECVEALETYIGKFTGKEMESM